MLANISTNVKSANKFLNQNKETVVFIAVTEMFLVHPFSKTKNVAKKANAKAIHIAKSHQPVHKLKLGKEYGFSTAD